MKKINNNPNNNNNNINNSYTNSSNNLASYPVQSHRIDSLSSQNSMDNSIERRNDSKGTNPTDNINILNGISLN